MNNIDQQTPSKYIILDPSPALQHEGELGDMPQADRMSGSKWKRESSALDDETVVPPRKLWKNLHVNYHYLNDPFKEDKEHKLTLTSAEITYMAYTESTLRGTELKTLQEAKRSPEWPHWEKAIQTELTQLNNMGTWKLVKNPSDRAPISNKWVFLQKFTKTRELLKYKA